MSNQLLVNCRCQRRTALEFQSVIFTRGPRMSLLRLYKALWSAKLPFTLRGHVAPVLTPFLNDSKRSLNLSIIPGYAKYLADKGIRGVLVNGTLGEGPSMNVEERKSVAESWANAVKSTKQHFMLQIGGAPLPDVVELARHAEKIGADSLLCLPELYFKPTTSKQLVDYMRIVAEAAPNTPLLYYHGPKFSGVNIDVVKFLESVEDTIPTLVGIKYSGGNLDEAALALAVKDKKFTVFMGNNQVLAGAFALGIDSTIATTLNLVPEMAIEIMTSINSGDVITARETQEKLTKIVLAVAKHGHWVETFKVAMGLLTPLNVGPPRAPLTPLSSEVVASMKENLKALGLKV